MLTMLTFEFTSKFKYGRPDGTAFERHSIVSLIGYAVVTTIAVKNKRLHVG